MVGPFEFLTVLSSEMVPRLVAFLRLRDSFDWSAVGRSGSRRGLLERLRRSGDAVGMDSEGDTRFCLCEGTASAPGDLRRAETGEFVPSTGEERGRATWTVGREAARSVLPVLATSTSTESSNPLVSLPTFSTNAGGCLTFAFGSSEGLILGVVLSEGGFATIQSPSTKVLALFSGLAGSFFLMSRSSALDWASSS